MQNARPPATPGWEVVRLGAGVGFSAAAVYNAAVTFPAPERFLGPAREAVWFGPSRWLLDRVVTPHPRAVMASVVAYEALTGVLLLGRGPRVRLGVAAAMTWAAVTTPVLPAGQALGNAAIVPVLAPLLRHSYPERAGAFLRR